MKFEYNKKSEEVRKPVAVIHYSHLVIRGDEGEAIYLCSDSAAISRAFCKEKGYFDDILDRNIDGVERRFYEGDSITITF